MAKGCIFPTLILDTHNLKSGHQLCSTRGFKSVAHRQQKLLNISQRKKVLKMKVMINNLYYILIFHIIIILHIHKI